MNWYLKLPNAIRAGINTAWQSAVGSFAVLVLGFLATVQEWSGDTSRDFPSVSPLGKAVGSIFVGLVVGVLTAVFRTIKPGPSYPKTAGAPPADRGQATLQTLVYLLGAIILIAIIVLWIAGRN